LGFWTWITKAQLAALQAFECFFSTLGGTRKRIRQQETKSLAASQIPVGNKIQEEELCGKLLKKTPAGKYPVFKPAKSPDFQIGARKFDSLLNQLGSQGWELVFVFTTHQENGRSGEAMAVFKRLRKA